MENLEEKKAKEREQARIRQQRWRENKKKEDEEKFKEERKELMKKYKKDTEEAKAERAEYMRQYRLKQKEKLNEEVKLKETMNEEMINEYIEKLKKIHYIMTKKRITKKLTTEIEKVLKKEQYNMNVIMKDMGYLQSVELIIETFRIKTKTMDVFKEYIETVKVLLRSLYSPVFKEHLDKMINISKEYIK